VVEDINTRKEAETKLIEAQRRTRAAAVHLDFIANTMAAAVTRCTRDLRYAWANQRYADWIQRPVHDITGRGTKVSVRMPTPAMDVRASDGEIQERAAV
jgi:PAS domain-containing protein